MLSYPFICPDEAGYIILTYLLEFVIVPAKKDSFFFFFSSILCFISLFLSVIHCPFFFHFCLFDLLTPQVSSETTVLVGSLWLSRVHSLLLFSVFIFLLWSVGRSLPVSRAQRTSDTFSFCLNASICFVFSAVLNKCFFVEMLR